jgi:hypothetical protein
VPEREPLAGGSTGVIDPGNFAQYVFTIVTAVGALAVVFTVTRRIALGGAAKRRRLEQGTGLDPRQEAMLGQLAAELESLRAEAAVVRRELDEAHNRLDFTERLLAQAKERGLLNAPKAP